VSVTMKGGPDPDAPPPPPLHLHPDHLPSSGRRRKTSPFPSMGGAAGGGMGPGVQVQSAKHEQCVLPRRCLNGSRRPDSCRTCLPQNLPCEHGQHPLHHVRRFRRPVSVDLQLSPRQFRTDPYQPGFAATRPSCPARTRRRSASTLSCPRARRIKRRPPRLTTLLLTSRSRRRSWTGSRW
jgi:hypothetical protein